MEGQKPHSEKSYEVNLFLNRGQTASSIQKTLGDRGLNVACKPCPCATAVHAQLNILMLGCETKQLA